MTDKPSGFYDYPNGEFWYPKNIGGLLLQQATDIGYKQGFKDAVDEALALVKKNVIITPEDKI